VVVNAISPIAVTRMVTAALERASGAGDRAGSRAAGGLSLASMPTPDELGPFGAYLLSDEVAWCSGQVLFAGGSEAALIDPPRLLEVVRTEGATSLAEVVDAFVSGALVPAEAGQASGGGSNPRFGDIFQPQTDGAGPPPVVRACAVVGDRPELVAGVTAALDERGIAWCVVDPGAAGPGFAGAADALAAVDGDQPVDAVVLALAGTRPASGGGAGWERMLAEHADIVERIFEDARWTRAAADLSAALDRPLRLVTVADAATAGGRSRAQAAAQLARAAAKATDGRMAAFAVSLEAADERGVPTAGALVAHLLASEDAPSLSGAELAVDDGWLGLRSHPRPSASITFGGPDLPAWFDAVLRSCVGVAGPQDGPARASAAAEEVG
jgi:hypothetical protein